MNAGRSSFWSVGFNVDSGRLISFIVPAHNKQACLGRMLQAIQESARIVDQPYEVIVVDDASTDATAEIARQNDARVVSVTHRKIAATRNSGGRAARGERLFFIDADTMCHPRAVASALQYMDFVCGPPGAPRRARFGYGDEFTIGWLRPMTVESMQQFSFWQTIVGQTSGLPVGGASGPAWSRRLHPPAGQRPAPRKTK